MYIIRTVNTKRFSLNGIEYLKNYVTNASEDLIEIFNCYNRFDVLVAPTPYNQFILNGTIYNSASQLQAALADVLYVRTTLGAVAADISQDNIDIVRRIFIPTYSMSAIVNAINTGEAFTISDTQSIWFSVSITSGTSSVPRGSVYKYKMKGIGKGDYGSNNGFNSPIAISASNLELVYFSVPTRNIILNDASTQTINLGTILPGMNWSSTLNSRPASSPISIQPTEDGFTVLKALVNNESELRLWQGNPGKYGQGAQQATEDNFEMLPDDSGYRSFSYDDVLETGPKSQYYAEHQDEGQENITGYGTKIYHKNNTSKVSIEFEDPVSDVIYNIPAKTSDDIFLMESDINKPVVMIYDDDIRLRDGVFILEDKDYKHWLSFEVSHDFTIQIQSDRFSKYTLIEGDVCGTGRAKFEAHAPFTLITGENDNPKTSERNSVFGLKFRSNDTVLLFGKLESK